ncbi:TIGR01777 family oxidoreductase [Salinactinospora qingdaonensis]|uniref:TIGR01777 family oxidoreductase n=1 Tax=Salinactinospora qingdaonensis TaxID=702744 RepID=A0ABP7FD40_9ACTN
MRSSLAQDGHEIIRLVRHEAHGGGEAEWDPERGYVDEARLAGSDAVVHLAAAPIGPTRWTARRKRLLRDSRIKGTRTLATAVAGMDHPPKRLISASAVGFYGDTGTTATTEAASQGEGFLANLVNEWEEATEPARAAGVSVAHSRTGVVVARSGGLLGFLLPLFKAGLGGRVGSGRQYMSWVSLDDAVGALRFLLDHPDITGPVNVTAPEPTTNAAYTKALGRVLHRPTVTVAPAPALRLAVGEFADECVLVSQRVVPERLLAAGYSFRHPDIDSALSDIMGR